MPYRPVLLRRRQLGLVGQRVAAHVDADRDSHEERPDPEGQHDVQRRHAHAEAHHGEHLDPVDAHRLGERGGQHARSDPMISLEPGEVAGLRAWLDRLLHGVELRRGGVGRGRAGPPRHLSAPCSADDRIGCPGEP
jgi:hypothetical protein